MKLDSLVREKYPEFIAGYVRVSGVTIERPSRDSSRGNARYSATSRLDTALCLRSTSPR